MSNECFYCIITLNSFRSIDGISVTTLTEMHMSPQRSGSSWTPPNLCEKTFFPSSMLCVVQVQYTSPWESAVIATGPETVPLAIIHVLHASLVSSRLDDTSHWNWFKWSERNEEYIRHNLTAKCESWKPTDLRNIFSRWTSCRMPKLMPLFYDKKDLLKSSQHSFSKLITYYRPRLPKKWSTLKSLQNLIDFKGCKGEKLHAFSWGSPAKRRRKDPVNHGQYIVNIAQ